MSLVVILYENAWDDENPVINASLGNSEVRASTWQVYKKYSYYGILIIIRVCIMDNEHRYNMNSFIVFIFLESPVR